MKSAEAGRGNGGGGNYRWDAMMGEWEEKEQMRYDTDSGISEIMQYREIMDSYEDDLRKMSEEERREVVEGMMEKLATGGKLDMREQLLFRAIGNSDLGKGVIATTALGEVESAKSPEGDDASVNAATKSPEITASDVADVKETIQTTFDKSEQNANDNIEKVANGQGAGVVADEKKVCEAIDENMGADEVARKLSAKFGSAELSKESISQNAIVEGLMKFENDKKMAKNLLTFGLGLLTEKGRAENKAYIDNVKSMGKGMLSAMTGLVTNFFTYKVGMDSFAKKQRIKMAEAEIDAALKEGRLNGGDAVLGRLMQEGDDEEFVRAGESVERGVKSANSEAVANAYRDLAKAYNSGSEEEIDKANKAYDEAVKQYRGEVSVNNARVDNFEAQRQKLAEVLDGKKLENIDEIVAKMDLDFTEAKGAKFGAGKTVELDKVTKRILSSNTKGVALVGGVYAAFTGARTTLRLVAAGAASFFFGYFSGKQKAKEELEMHDAKQELGYEDADKNLNKLLIGEKLAERMDQAKMSYNQLSEAIDKAYGENGEVKDAEALATAVADIKARTLMMDDGEGKALIQFGMDEQGNSLKDAQYLMLMQKVMKAKKDLAGQVDLEKTVAAKRAELTALLDDAAAARKSYQRRQGLKKGMMSLTLMSVFGGATETLSGRGEEMVQNLIHDFAHPGDLGKALVESIKSAAANPVDAVGNWGLSFLKGLAGPFAGVAQLGLNAVGDLADGTGNAVDEAMENLRNGATAHAAETEESGVTGSGHKLKDIAEANPNQPATAESTAETDAQARTESTVAKEAQAPEGTGDGAEDVPAGNTAAGEKGYNLSPEGYPDYKALGFSGEYDQNGNFHFAGEYSTETDLHYDGNGEPIGNSFLPKMYDGDWEPGNTDMLANKLLAGMYGNPQSALINSFMNGMNEITGPDGNPIFIGNMSEPELMNLAEQMESWDATSYARAMEEMTTRFQDLTALGGFTETDFSGQAYASFYYTDGGNGDVRIDDYVRKANSHLFTSDNLVDMDRVKAFFGDNVAEAGWREECGQFSVILKTYEGTGDVPVVPGITTEETPVGSEPTPPEPEPTPDDGTGDEPVPVTTTTTETVVREVPGEISYVDRFGVPTVSYVDHPGDVHVVDRYEPDTVSYVDHEGRVRVIDRYGPDTVSYVDHEGRLRVIERYGDDTVSYVDVPGEVTVSTITGEGTVSYVTVPGETTVSTLTGEGTVSYVTVPGETTVSTITGEGTVSYVTTPGETTVSTIAGENTVSYVTTPGEVTVSTITGEGTVSYVTVPGETTVSTITGENTVSYVTTPGEVTVSTITGESTVSYVTRPGGVTAVIRTGETTISYVDRPGPVSTVERPEETLQPKGENTGAGEGAQQLGETPERQEGVTYTEPDRESNFVNPEDQPGDEVNDADSSVFEGIAVPGSEGLDGTMSDPLMRNPDEGRPMAEGDSTPQSQGGEQMYITNPDGSESREEVAQNIGDDTQTSYNDDTSRRDTEREGQAAENPASSSNSEPAGENAESQRQSEAGNTAPTSDEDRGSWYSRMMGNQGE